MLHLFNAGPEKKELLQTCLALLTDADVIVLLGESVGFAAELLAVQSQRIKAGKKHFALCVVFEDIERNNTQLPAEQVAVITTSQLVEIAIEHGASQTWY